VRLVLYTELTTVSRFITEKLRVAEHFEKFPVFRRSPPAYLSNALFTLYLHHCHYLLIADTVILLRHTQNCASILK